MGEGVWFEGAVVSPDSAQGEVVIGRAVSFIGEVTLSEFGADVVVEEQQEGYSPKFKVRRRISIPMHAIAWIRWAEEVSETDGAR